MINDLRAKKSLGQHWLEDNSSLDSIVEFSGVQTGDNVLEIGPGKGSLTKKLLSAGAKVIAVEKDERLAGKLSSELNGHLEIYADDILKFDLAKLPRNYKVVANIPYYLTSKLIRYLAESDNPPGEITLLVQKEVAERICAPPGSMSLLSVSAQLYYDCNPGSIIPAKLFTPPPKVDSRLVNMRRKSVQIHQNIDVKQFFRVVKAGFSSRRKTLLNSLSGGLILDKNLIEKRLKATGLNPSRRPQELSVADWLKLSQNLTR